MTSEEFQKLKHYNKGIDDLLKYQANNPWDKRADFLVFIAVFVSIFLPIGGSICLLAWWYCELLQPKELELPFPLY